MVYMYIFLHLLGTTQLIEWWFEEAAQQLSSTASFSTNYRWRHHTDRTAQALSVTTTTYRSFPPTRPA